MSSLFFHLLVCKQKRGPGFKYASNLPGSLLKEQKAVKEEGESTSTSTAKRKPEGDDISRHRPEEREPLYRHPPVLTPSTLPRPRPEDKLRKKRKLFDDDEEEDFSVRKKVDSYFIMRFLFQCLLV